MQDFLPLAGSKEKERKDFSAKRKKPKKFLVEKRLLVTNSNALLLWDLNRLI
jgi:hypothetical protein